jgi:hypothetical protein
MDAEFNENDAGVVTRFFASFQDLAARDRGTFAVIHHNNREDEFRGSSAIPANIDTGYMVKNLDRAGGTKLDMMTLTPSIKTRRLSDRATFYYDNGAFNCDPGPLASARAENIALTTILRENPGITGKQFEKASADAGISRDQARRFLQTGVEFDQIRREPGAHNSGRYYLKFSSPNQFAETPSSPRPRTNGELNIESAIS